jgi:hypothetical protein
VVRAAISVERPAAVPRNRQPKHAPLASAFSLVRLGGGAAALARAPEAAAVAALAAAAAAAGRAAARHHKTRQRPRGALERRQAPGIGLGSAGHCVGPCVGPASARRRRPAVPLIAAAMLPRAGAIRWLAVLAPKQFESEYGGSCQLATAAAVGIAAAAAAAAACAAAERAAAQRAGTILSAAAGTAAGACGKYVRGINPAGEGRIKRS